jgi:LmbE family N-acetylglucosaminyl deacetylase
MSFLKKYFRNKTQMNYLIRKIISKRNNSILLEKFSRYLDLIFNTNRTIYPELQSSPEGERILVLSPHADDETLGCGGTILNYIHNKKEVMVILFSDNSKSIFDKNNDEIITIRSNEFKSAMDSLNVKNFVELKLSPSNFIEKESNVKALSELIKNYNPDHIFLPNFIENHWDHIIINQIFYKVIKKLDLDVKIMLFEVWTPLIPNVVIDISKFIDGKIKALKEYKSQLINIDYISTIIGLNKYRSITNLKGEGYCEAFIAMSVKDYKRFKEKFL